MCVDLQYVSSLDLNSCASFLLREAEELEHAAQACQSASQKAAYEAEAMQKRAWALDIQITLMAIWEQLRQQAERDSLRAAA